jgi:hypothetical protein
VCGVCVMSFASSERDVHGIVCRLHLVFSPFLSLSIDSAIHLTDPHLAFTFLSLLFF